MKEKNNMRIATRMQILIGLTLIGLIVLCVAALMQLKGTMLDDRKQKTQNLVEVALGTLNYHHKLAEDGKLSVDEAKSAARETLRGLRYDTNDYFFIIDTNANYILMPPKPASEGQNAIDVKDANGKLIFQELIAAGQRGGGFVEYVFPRLGQQKSEPKLSYAGSFTPWAWVLGTGIYIDDVEAEYWKGMLSLGGISLVLLAVLSLIGWRVSAGILQQLGGEPAEATAVMQQVAAGDLTAAVGNRREGSLLHALGTMVNSLRELVKEINVGANQVVQNAEQISTASREVSIAADHQSDATSAMAAAIEELTVSSNHISESASETEQDSLAAMTEAGEGSQRVEQATAAIQKIATTVAEASRQIHELEDRTKQVSSIANVIKDIAGQTNLLALNAAIEAARAGEQGRGFAVVADEVRKLAERTSSATIEIEQMIIGIQQDTIGAVSAMNSALPEVEHGVELAGSASDSLRAIEAGAGRTLGRVREVADATREQSAASTSIAQRVETIAQMVEETSSTIRGTAETANQLELIAQGLKAQIGRFQV